MKSDKEKPALKKPDWIPDWRDEKNYPDPATTTAQQWAWEFLRRNPQYQADYAEFSLHATDSFIKDIKEYESCYRSGELPMGIDMWEAMLEDGDMPPSPPIYQKICRDYNLVLPIDPKNNNEIPSFFKYAERPAIKTRHYEELFDVSLSSNTLFTVTIDVSQPKGPQLEYVEGFIDGYRKQIDKSDKRQSKTHRYREYLQILDVLLYENTRSKKIEVCKALHKESTDVLLDRLRKSYDRAIELMHFGFIKLSEEDRKIDKSRYLEGKELGESLVKALPK